MRRPALLVLPLVAALATACSGSGEAEQSPADALASARSTLADAKTVSVSLTSEGVPEGITGVTSATGKGVIDESEPRFAGDVTGRVMDTPATVPVIAIGDTTWMKLFSSSYKEFDMASLGAPNPAQMFDPKDGLPSLLGRTTDATAGDEKRDGATVVREYSGTVPAQAVEDLLLLGQDAQSFEVTYGIDAQTHQLRTARITGAFWKDSTSTYTVRLSDYGAPVTIEAP